MKNILMFIMILFVSILTIGGCGMDITNPQTFDHIKEANGAILRCTVIEIGPWNIFTGTGWAGAHNFADIHKICSINVIIRNDNGNTLFPFPTASAGATTIEQIRIFANHLELVKGTNGLFDNLSYQSILINRGWITIWCRD